MMTPTQERFTTVLDDSESLLFPQRIEHEKRWGGRGKPASRVMWHRFQTEAELVKNSPTGHISPAAFSKSPCGVNMTDVEFPRRTPRATNMTPMLCPLCFATKDAKNAATQEVLDIYNKVRQ